MSGRPVPSISQDEVPPEEDQSEPKSDPRLVNRLLFGTDWSSEPVHPEQEFAYPDTVVEVDVRYEVLSVSSVKDMDRYSVLQLSTNRRGRWVIRENDERKWDEKKGTWLVLLLVVERKFKSLHTASSDPKNP